MSKENFKEESKKDWYSKSETSDSHLQIGCLQRIASSLEKMEKPFDKLIKDAEHYKQCYESTVEHNRFLIRRIAALQGVITKLKKKRP